MLGQSVFAGMKDGSSVSVAANVRVLFAGPMVISLGGHFVRVGDAVNVPEYVPGRSAVTVATAPEPLTFVASGLVIVHV